MRPCSSTEKFVCFREDEEMGERDCLWEMPSFWSDEECRKRENIFGGLNEGNPVQVWDNVHCDNDNC